MLWKCTHMSMRQQGDRRAVWSLLAIILFLAGVAYIEELVPELETQTQDEQALAGFCNALKTDEAVIETPPVPIFNLPIMDVASGVARWLNLVRQAHGVYVHPPSLPLYQRLLTYRI